MSIYHHHHYIIIESNR